MRTATWYKVRRFFPYNVLVFQPRREFTVREIVEIAERAGYSIEVRVSLKEAGR